MDGFFGFCIAAYLVYKWAVKCDERRAMRRRWQAAFKDCTTRRCFFPYRSLEL